MTRAAISTPVTDATIRGAITRETVGQKLNPEVTAEGTVGAVVIDDGFGVGDVRRYVLPDGVTDNTAALQDWLDVCSTAQIFARFESHPMTTAAYVLDGRLLVAPGIRGIIGNGATLKAVGIGTTGTDYDGIVLQECEDAVVTGLNFDANDKFCRCIVMENCQRVEVTDNRIVNVKTGSGIRVEALDTGSQDSRGIRIHHNYLQGSTLIADVGVAIDFQAGFDPAPHADLTAYWKANSAVPPTPFRNYRCVVQGNVIDGIRYAIQLNGVDYSTVAGNTMSDNTRGIVANFSSNFNAISNNTINQFISTGIYLTMASTDNVVSNNLMHTTLGSSAAVYNILGSKRNHYIGNKVRSDSATPDLRYFVYVGVECDDVIVQSNDLRGRTIQPGICVESAWDDATAENSSRAWGESVLLTGHANAGMSGVVIKGNRIEMDMAPEHAIALLQVNDAGVDYSLSRCVVQDNTVIGVSTPGGGKQLYLAEDTAGQSFDHIVLDNNFDPDDDYDGFVFPRGRAHFSVVAGNTILDVGDHTVTFAGGDATPSVALSHVFRTANVVTITNFDDGIDGQEFGLLALHAATVSNNASIKTSTGANKVLTVNVFYKFKRIGGVWYEQATN